MTFQKGESGNPAGRPRGIRDQRTLLAEQLLEGDTDAIVRKAIELAKAGDSTALRLCIERICPNLRQRPVMFELPPMQRAADAAAGMAAIAQGLAEGSVTPGEAADLAKVVQTFATTLDITDIEERLTRVEGIMKEKEAKAPSPVASS